MRRDHARRRAEACGARSGLGALPQEGADGPLVMRQRTGSEPEGDDEGALHDANQRFVGGGTRYRALVRAIALSPSFRAVRAPHAEAR